MKKSKRDRLDDMAAFVVAFNFTPDAYWRMTVAEREAIIREANRQAKRNK